LLSLEIKKYVTAAQMKMPECLHWESLQLLYDQLNELQMLAQDH
jgi:hypothetical protein